MLVDAVIERLADAVPDLSGRINGALQLARLRQQNALPQATPAAFVILGDIEGGEVASASGAFVQAYRDVIAVVLVVRTNDSPAASRSGDALHPLIWAVIEALVGRRLEGAVGQMALRRAFLVSLADGAAVYQIEFSQLNQMRLAR
ncbi:hypothetical protein D2T29_19630 [Sinirhodobacter populi]|uniref:DUF3168 domain-containing protein n=1 Tax=Paenirhodobacter populi TaxID=2306993 RepID=A0A443K1Z9_9RHOB|nr:hypothetical protein [Sinirhodobacter populi]RWR26790.1 hypothetical protein D2T29_19630 [Sinirhodobacter populi]